MTMFNELYALAKTATLTMIVSADEQTGKLTVSVLPKPRKDVGEIALTKDLTLTATPEEFDEGFVAALQGYREVRTSLREQAEATKEVLEAAKSASSKKASEAVVKASKPVTAAKPATAKTTVENANANADDNDDDDDDDETGTEVTAPAQGESLSLFA